MIAASAVLVVVAFITLIIGIFQTGLGLIWMSIAASVLAAIFLVLGVVRGRPPKVATAAGPMPGGWGEGATTYAEPTVETGEDAWAAEPETPALVLDEPVEEMVVEEEPVVEEVEEIAPVVPPRRAASSRSSAARTSTSRATGSRSAASSRSGTTRPARTPAAQVEVVIIPDRDKFHKATCRYAKNAGAMTTTKSEARREGYKACGVCKP